jgi:hypothetical protein
MQCCCNLKKTPGIWAFKIEIASQRNMPLSNTIWNVQIVAAANNWCDVQERMLSEQKAKESALISKYFMIVRKIA